MRGGAGALVVAALLLWNAPIWAQPASVQTTLTVSDPDPDAEEGQLGLRSLPLESRTDLLANVSRDTPGAVPLNGGVGISGGRADETHLLLDGFRVSRLSVPLAMLGGVQVHRAGYGAPLADVTGGAVAAFTRAERERWTAGLDLFQDRRDPRSTTTGISTAGPLLKQRLHLLVGLEVQRASAEPIPDPDGIFPTPPAIEGRAGRAGVKLSYRFGSGRRLDLLAAGEVASQDNAPELGRDKETQPRWEDSYRLLALRWGGPLAGGWLTRAQLALETSGTKLLPKQCQTRPDCLDIPVEVFSYPNGITRTGNFETHAERRQRAAEASLSVQRVLPDWSGLQWAARLGTRLQAGWRERLWQAPGNQLTEYMAGVPFAQTRFYANDPRWEPPREGPVRASWETLRVVGFAEVPVRVLSRLHLLPGVGLISTRGEFGEQRPAATAVTPHLAAEFEALPRWELTVRASTHRRADANLDALDQLTPVYPVSRRCYWNHDTQAFDRDCGYSPGGRTSLGLPCNPAGVDASGAPCRQALGMPRTWEHTLGAGMHVGAGLRLDMDVIERRTTGMWARLETNRIWTVTGQEASFQGYRNGRAEAVYDVSTPDGPSRKYRALTTALQRPLGDATVLLAHTFSRSQSPLHPIPGLAIIDDDGGRHFVHLQSVLTLRGLGSIGVRYRYAQGERILPLYGNSVSGTEPFHVLSQRELRGQGPLISPADRIRQPSVNELSLQVRVSLRRWIRIADAQLYADALNVFPSGEFSRRSQYVGSYGLGLGVPAEEWYRIGLQAGF